MKYHLGRDIAENIEDQVFGDVNGSGNQRYPKDSRKSAATVLRIWSGFVIPRRQARPQHDPWNRAKQIGAHSRSARVYTVQVQLAIRSGATGLNSGLKASENIMRMRDDGIALAS